MKNNLRFRAAVAVGALMTAVGLGAVATPFLAAASASTVDSTPATTIFKADYEAAHPGDNNAWGKAMSNPSVAFCGGDATTSVSFSGNTTVPLAANVGKVVIHAGSYVFIYVPGTAGVAYQTPKVDINGNMISQAISWAVTCGEGESSTSTDPATETPTDPATETPTDPATETPTDPATETTTPPAATTPAGEESVQAASTTPAGSLAHTGGNGPSGPSGLLLALGLLLAGGGAALMAMTRRTGSHA